MAARSVVDRHTCRRGRGVLQLQGHFVQRCFRGGFDHTRADRRLGNGPICPVVHIRRQTKPTSGPTEPLDCPASLFGLGDGVKHIIGQYCGLVATRPGQEWLRQCGERGGKQGFKRTVALFKLLLVLRYAFHQHRIRPRVHVRIAHTQRHRRLVDQIGLAARCEASLIGGDDLVQHCFAFVVLLDSVVWCRCLYTESVLEAFQRNLLGSVEIRHHACVGDTPGAKKVFHHPAHVLLNRHGFHCRGIVVVRQRFVNARNALGADQVMQVLRQTRKFFVFLLLFLCFLSLCQIFRVFLKILPNLFALFFQHFAIFFPSMLVVLVLPAVVSSKAFLQLDAKIIK
mmetsp:Transcript_23882/g.41284  ORF Transcript_23882/g.41284 Transcript_23882/m.41284 type:complete len:341 (-) Transcript_23882:345-1367(-)